MQDMFAQVFFAITLASFILPGTSAAFTVQTNEPDPEFVIEALNEIGDQFSGTYFEVTFGSPATVGETTYSVWNPTNLSRRRLEQITEPSPGASLSRDNHYCQLHNRKHYVEASWIVFPLGTTAPNGTPLISQKPMLRVYDAQSKPFLLPEAVAFCEQRCGLDAVTLTEVLRSGNETTVVKRTAVGSPFDWELVCRSETYGKYTIGFDVADGGAMIKSIEVVKSAGHELLSPGPGPETNVIRIGHKSEGTYAGLQSIRLTLINLEYSATGLTGWDHAISMEFENVAFAPGIGTVIHASLDKCHPLSDDLSDLIEFESFNESEIAMVMVPDDDQIVYGVTEGKLVKLIDNSAASVARSSRLGDRSGRKWWYVFMGIGLLAVTSYLMWRRASTS